MKPSENAVTGYLSKKTLGFAPLPHDSFAFLLFY